MLGLSENNFLAGSDGEFAETFEHEFVSAQWHSEDPSVSAVF